MPKSSTKSNNHAVVWPRLPAKSPLVTYDYVFNISKFPLAVKPITSVRSGEPGWHHHEDFYEIVLIVSGKGRHICEDKNYLLYQQEVFVIPPGMHHNYETGDLIYYNVLVNLERLQLPLFDLSSTTGFQNLFVLAPQSHIGSTGNPLRTVLPPDAFARALQLVKQMDNLQNQQPEGYKMAMVGTFIDFLQVICHAGDSSIKSSGAAVEKSRIISALAMNLAENCHRPWQVEKMCRECGMSRSVLFREFKKYYNVSPVMFLNNQRLRKACALLEQSDEDLEYIAGECGFANSSYLATAFKRAFNTTPLKYRKMHRLNN